MAKPMDLLALPSALRQPHGGRLRQSVMLGTGIGWRR